MSISKCTCRCCQKRDSKVDNLRSALDHHKKRGDQNFEDGVDLLEENKRLREALEQIDLCVTLVGAMTVARKALGKTLDLMKW